MSQPRSWYAFKAKAEKESELCIYDEIGAWGITASAFIRELQQHAGRALTVRINSPGGALTEGIAIFNALRRHDGEVTTCIDGMAASMASYVALAGKTVKMADNAYLMIHNPSGGAFGNADDLRSAADLIDKMKGTLVDAYVAKSGKDAETVSAAMDKETWFNAAEAKDYGLIDEVTGSVKIAAHFDLSKFRHAPVDTLKPSNPMITQEQLDAEVSAKTIAQAQAQANFTALQTITAERDGIKAKLADEEGKSAELAKGMNDAKAKLDKHAQDLKAATEVTVEKINTRANEILASHGHEPLKFKSGGAVENTMSREDFEALPPSARAEFCRKGGKIAKE